MCIYTPAKFPVPKSMSKTLIFPMLAFAGMDRCLTFMLGTAGHGDFIRISTLENGTKKYMPYYYCTDEAEIKQRLQILVQAAACSNKLPKLVEVVKNNAELKDSLKQAITKKELTLINKLVFEAVIDRNKLGFYFGDDIANSII